MRSALVLEGVIAFLTGTDLDHVLNIIDEDFAVADISGIQRLLNGLDQGLDRNTADNDIDLDFRQQAGGNRSSSEVESVALLGAVT